MPLVSHTHSCAHTHKCTLHSTCTDTHSLEYSQTCICTFSLTRVYAHIRFYTHMLTLTHAHLHTRTLAYTRVHACSCNTFLLVLLFSQVDALSLSEGNGAGREVAEAPLGTQLLLLQPETLGNLRACP